MAFTSDVELQIFHIYCLWCHLCLPVCGSWNCIEWVGLEGTLQGSSGPTLRPGQGHHSSTHFCKGPIKLLLPPLQALTVETADPETGTCSMAQTCSNFPRRSCPLTVGQQSFASFTTFTSINEHEKEKSLLVHKGALGCPVECVHMAGNCSLLILEYGGRHVCFLLYAELNISCFLLTKRCLLPVTVQRCVLHSSSDW